MRDRIPTQVLENGAIRYAVYDETGAFLRYEYILPADEPTEEGTPLNKGTLLSDALCAALGLTNEATPTEALSKLLDIEQTRIVTGEYTGDGAATRQILLGFTPKAVILMDGRGATYDYTINYYGTIYGGLALLGSDVIGLVTAIKIVSNGFVVAYRQRDTSISSEFYATEVRTNNSNLRYNYIALR